MALLAGVFLVSGCDINCDSTNKERSGLDQLDDRRQQWQELALVSYDIRYYRSCFCAIEYVRISMVEGAVAAMQTEDAEGYVTRLIPVEEYANYYTIDDFFP